MRSIIKKQQQKQRDYIDSFVRLSTLLTQLAEITLVSDKFIASALLIEAQNETTTPFPTLFSRDGDIYIPTSKNEMLQILKLTSVHGSGYVHLIHTDAAGNQIKLEPYAFCRKEFANWLLEAAPNDKLPRCLISAVRTTAVDIKRAEQQPTDQGARVRALETERDHAQRALADAITCATATETRATAAERERDTLRKRLTEIEQQTARGAPNARAAAQTARHATSRAETLAAALYLLAVNPNEYRDSTNRVIAARLAEAINDKAHLWWREANAPLSIKTMSEHIAKALTDPRVIGEDSRVIENDASE